MRARAISLIVCVSGCGVSSSYTPMSEPVTQPTAARPLKGASAIDVYESSKIPREYYEVGIIEVSARQTTLNNVLFEMKREAAEAGCDAVIVDDLAQKATANGKAVQTGSYLGTCVAYQPGARQSNAKD